MLKNMRLLYKLSSDFICMIISEMEKQMKYKALALDLDGTLIDSNKNLSEKNKGAVIAAAKRGVHIILASGRPMFGISPVAEALELSKTGGYILAYNGGNIADCKTGELIYSNNFPAECIHDVCELARKHGVYALSYDNDHIVSESDSDEYVLREAKCNAARVQQVEDLERYVTYPVAKFLIAGEHKKLLPIRDELLAKHGEIINAFCSADYFLEIVPKTVAKDSSLAVLLKKLGLKREELIACGDGMNDISMIEYAGLGVAMENAYEPVKERADIIAPSNDNDGVAEIIAKYFM